MKIAYARVSTADQDNTAQIAALRSSGCGHRIEEKNDEALGVPGLSQS